MLSPAAFLIYAACIVVGLWVRTWQAAALGGLIIDALVVALISFVSQHEGEPLPVTSLNAVAAVLAFPVAAIIVFGLLKRFSCALAPSDVHGA